MTEKPNFDRFHNVERTGDDRSRSVKVIAVGDCNEWRRQGHALQLDGIAFLEYEDITEETLNYYQPVTVCSPLLAKNFDCIDLAVLLHGLGYSGEYLASAPDVPNPELIEREVRYLCPQLDFRITSSA